MSRSDHWSSYDEAASTFDAISVPAYFTRPARRLIEMLHFSASDRLLDVGSGTGIVAACALEMTPFVIALDLSCAMLLRAMAGTSELCCRDGDAVAVRRWVIHPSHRKLCPQPRFRSGSCSPGVCPRDYYGRKHRRDYMGRRTIRMRGCQSLERSCSEFVDTVILTAAGGSRVAE